MIKELFHEAAVIVSASFFKSVESFCVQFFTDTLNPVNVLNSLVERLHFLAGLTVLLECVSGEDLLTIEAVKDCFKGSPLALGSSFGTGEDFRDEVASFDSSPAFFFTFCLGCNAGIAGSVARKADGNFRCTRCFLEPMLGNYNVEQK